MVRDSLALAVDGTTGMLADGAMLGIEPTFAPGIKLITLINSFASDMTKPIASLIKVMNLPTMSATVPIALPQLSASL